MYIVLFFNCAGKEMIVIAYYCIQNVAILLKSLSIDCLRNR